MEKKWDSRAQKNAGGRDVEGVGGWRGIEREPIQSSSALQAFASGFLFKMTGWRDHVEEDKGS